MESSWNEVQSFCDPNINKVSPISSLCWDPFRELLWVGNDSGRVTSYYAKGLQRYTSFKAHKDQQIRQLRVIDRGVISLSPKSIQMRDRRGLVKWNLSDDQIKDLHCMTTTTLTHGELLAAGQQDDMLVINLARGAITRTISDASNIVVMRNLPRAIACGSLLGEVTLRDSRTMKVEQRVQAHTAMLSDLDVSGNLLLTCGFSQRQGSLIMDPLVKVYDIRMGMRSLAPIPFPSGPMFLKMHPTLSTTCLVASQTGQFQMCDISRLTMGSYAPPAQFYQIQTSSYITAMDISSSAHTLAFGDGASFVYQYADDAEFDCNPYSLPLETSDIAPPVNVKMGEDSPLSSVGMPYYTEPLLSIWSPMATYEVGHPPAQIDEEVLRNMKTLDFVGYAPNPGNMLRNQIPRRKKAAHKKDIPKFRSEQEREMLMATNVLSSSVGDLKSVDPSGLIMPKIYSRVEIQYSKFGVDDFDFGYYNRTKYGGLETHIWNSYCNSLLQVLFFILPLRNIAKSHIKTSCPKENCLLCELGFLFRMLEDSKGQNCQATNFLRAFSTIPQAAALGLFEPETPDRHLSYSMLMQNFTRFIMEQLHQESNQPGSNPLISKTLNWNTLSHSKCGSCQHEISRITYPFVVDLLYPKKSKKRSFTSILKASMYRENQTKAWCPSCHSYQPTTTKKIIQGLPGVLLINSGASNHAEAAMWPANKPSSWLPERFGIHINGSELVIKALPRGKDIPAEFKGSPETCAIYELSSTILQIQAEEELPHLVAQIRGELFVDPTPMEATPWYLFNDFLVNRISRDDVLSFKGIWKTPSVLQYKRVDIDSLLDLSVLPSEVDYSLLFKDVTVATNPAKSPRYEILQPDEMPKPGTIVAIDAEFVALNQEETEIRSDGTKSLIRPSTLTLARVSVLRGDGEKEAVPFIDDYIATSEPIVDYLTEFSGIELGDLDPKTSKYTLVPLKIAYKKLRMLLDLGCIFIGHGLKKDFRIINLLVPPEQIIDTVDIYHIRNRQRKISLRFLAWHLLHQDIQSEGHDSIEDARTALILYKKYLEYRENGTFGQMLESVYEAGHRANWLKGPKDSHSRPSSTPPVKTSYPNSPLFAAGWPA
ncbi:ubiquitin carboxyl-terminal hydrolase-domain-containing protein [Radiomyces spectabilis]|uniref:ubiquitin carboxyl-terminal hydrolase-domain-containing protein n=1 Tax=Radiomyces spectabilis TaxID=64574 RepID=UPI00221F5F07|nr:ubiquitin carboxyl-terminal hydrolase-domain-containing protein [Radiomyces spectabilis]KAI8384404.1 ubiquitin carboxyl-terminal hydrolase-domain-containing protein [Radiomyces spectabilis]